MPSNAFAPFCLFKVLLPTLVVFLSSANGFAQNDPPSPSPVRRFSDDRLSGDGLTGGLHATDRIRFFEQKIRPLLHRKCVNCHGPRKQEGGLRLDSKEALIKGGASGTTIAAHESLLLEAVRYEGLEMPPDERLTKKQVNDLQIWIDDGAAWPEVDGTSVRLSGPSFTVEERSFWSLQPLTHTSPPALGWAANSDHPIDRFVLARLQQKGLRPAGPASSEQLVRRLYFGLLGVPPSPSNVEQFLQSANSSSENQAAIPNLIDQLLEDDRYGEHWSRYWLDIVRYSESDGFRADFYRPEAWRYRDYVVSAFNNDKPYDRFVEEQLAGDELFPDSVDAHIATGYLRTYLYEYNQRDARTQWQDVLNQVTDITGEALLGVSMGCARCHDHKFDPILQQDYFRLQAAFGSMLPIDTFTVATESQRQHHKKQLDQWKQKASALLLQRDQLREPYLKKATESAVIKFPEDVQEMVFKKKDIRRPLDFQIADLVQRQVLFEYDRVKYSSDDKKKIEQLDQKIKELAGEKPPELPTALTVKDTGNQLAEIYVAADPNQQRAAPGGLSILNRQPFALRPTQDSTGSRSALAKWITDPGHPLTSRVLVNRIWQHHFGTGLVKTASDFGSLGSRPSHPELLDWLADEFVARGYSIKWLQRLILTSQTYQRSAFHRNADVCENIDPDNKLRWRFDIQRLNAEQIRDAMLTCSGELSTTLGGPSVDGNENRRSLYIKQQRNTPNKLLKSLDGADGLNSIAKRNTTTTPTQALNLMNDSWVHERATAMANRVISQSAGNTPQHLTAAAFQIAYGRQPSKSDRELTVEWLQKSIGTEKRSGWSASLVSSATDNAALVNQEFGPLQIGSGQPWTEGPLTVVGAFRLDSLYPDATVRTIISCWNSSNKSPGWSVGITSEKSGFRPRNFILQVVTEKGYEVVPSGLRPELGVTYLMAVSVNSLKSGAGRASFYVRPLSNEQLSLSMVDFKTLTGLKAASPLVVGGRFQQKQHQWDGAVDQVALFRKALGRDAIEELFQQKLAAETLLKHQPAVAWSFDETGESLGANSGSEYSLRRDGQPEQNPLQKAVTELCHVLLNSNEFIYID